MTNDIEAEGSPSGDLGLKGTKGLLLGATGGLGLPMARELVSLGAELFVHGNSDSAALATLRTLPGVTGRLADLSDYEGVGRLFAEVDTWCEGSLDFMVYSAGVNPTAEPVSDIEVADWASAIDVNLTGAFYALKFGLPLLRASGHGKIVLISSIFGIESAANRGAYGAAKHGLTGLVQTVAREEGGVVQINALCPGPAWGENVRRIFVQHAKERDISLEDYVKERVAKIPAGRFLEPEELARATAVLCSRYSDYINGETIKITGGASE